MAGNVEAFLVRVAGVLVDKHQDRELSEFILALNALFLTDGYPKVIEAKALKLKGDFYRNYLKEWK